jgi:hypothetical protein
MAVSVGNLNRSLVRPISISSFTCNRRWGHGLDANDVNGGIANPSGEGIADVYAALRLGDSCIGRNFYKSGTCGGNGDGCISCSGVRDIDYKKRKSGNPHDFSWSNSNCGGAVHCVGGVYSEAVWSLYKRILQAYPYNYDDNTALEITTRLTFIAAGNGDVQNLHRFPEFASCFLLLTCIQLYFQL